MRLVAKVQIYLNNTGDIYISDYTHRLIDHAMGTLDIAIS